MVDNLRDELDAFTEDLGPTPTSPVSKFLIYVNLHTNPLSKKDRKIFHSVFARLFCWKANKARSPGYGSLSRHKDPED